MKWKRWRIKMTSWEYWPMWVLYVPVVFQHFYLALKAKSLFFFLKVNPAIKEGFILSDEKYTSLKLVPEENRPKTILIEKGKSLSDISDALKKNAIEFPIIVKPNIGFRGVLVKLCEKVDDLKGIDFNKTSYIIQEYIDFPVEVGVFYYRFPNSLSGFIPSITLKEFLSITGDGISTFSELIEQKPRAFLQYDKLKNTFFDTWDKVIPKGEIIKLENIGNHNRGTKFINGNHIIDEALLKVFDELSFKMKGFYFGRFDIRTSSIADLKKGKNFKILEVNGVGAEATHIYDPNYRLLDAWRETLFLWRIAFNIAMENKQKGEQFPVFSDAKKRYLQYKNYKKVALS
ncbi:ATP-grasp domain-containing protein [Galbibacter mesophilus]|uniref:D-alanine--D-alanine ligase n=1 Tax=Galbibacter mesophilus TaxID=379069 RepID=UPI00191CB4FB|nr:D-alanine--D-alanine ligase [Galbibacter mesophilus]MCM5663280.1 D-alanine--D-alanine ligase [Galbibacter mesophilus]